MSLIIDCHGHYTVLPKGHDAWREEQKAAFKAGTPCPPYPDISDADLRDVLSSNLCRCTGYENIVKAVRAAAADMGASS